MNMRFILTEKEIVDIDKKLNILYPIKTVSHADVKMMVFPKELKSMLKRLSKLNLQRFCCKHPKVAAELLKDFLK